MMSTLRVWLGDRSVGWLVRDDAERTEFRMDPAYRADPARPVLGQRFVDDPDGRYRARMRLPPWFSNLLPEGLLRDEVARAHGFRSVREFELIATLGEDLPGAVRVTSEDGAAPFAPDGAVDAPGPGPEAAPQPWKFSLAGVQLKFSVLRSGRGLTIPANGVGGDWIVKLPDARFSRVPENEFATMTLAAAAGLDVPEVRLVPIETITGLPQGRWAEANAFAIRRFDRAPGGRRIHQEDFAQIVDQYPEGKYDSANYETVAAIVWRVVGDEALARFLRRLVFCIGIGNADAHLKNWSLVYPDGRSPALSPAYDLVSTLQYLPEDRLALNLARSKRWEDVTRSSFARLAKRIGADEGGVLAAVADGVERFRSAWSDSRGTSLPLDSSDRARIDAHLARVPLFTDRGR